jgi:phosphonopyruvate decarboxylase
MTIAAHTFLDMLVEAGIARATGVPCSLLGALYAALPERRDIGYITAHNEGAALSLASGLALCGQPCATLMQDSGFGNLVNPLTSLSLPYGIGTVLIIGSHNPQTDEPQHRYMPKVVTAVLEALDIPFLDVHGDFDLHGATKLIRGSIASGGVVAIGIRRGSIAHDQLAGLHMQEGLSDRPDRAAAVRAVAEWLLPDTAVVATTGYISRELRVAFDRPENFYMLGSMGHAPAIGLGVALARARQGEVVLLDGDGALMMHLGVLSMIGEQRPSRFVHVVLDNELYETTGGQPSLSAAVNLAEVALANGYRSAVRCGDASTLAQELREARKRPGPHMLVAKIRAGETNALPSIVSHKQLPLIATQFSASLT